MRGKWHHYTVKVIEPSGTQHLVADGDWTDERNHTYIPARLPGPPRLQERVSLYLVKGQPYRRCVVGEQEYRMAGPYCPWVPVPMRFEA